MINKTIILTEQQLDNFINEKSYNDINVKPFEIKNSLHSKLWLNNKLNSKVRLKLLQIADDFVDNLGINGIKVEDIVLTGSLANYNWTKFSDIDVHIIVDYKKIYNKKEFVKGYFDGKKDIWKSEHKNLKIFGFPVEIYVEDKNEPAVSSGVYSLEKNEWVTEPEDKSNAKINANYVKKTSAEIMDEVDEIEKKLKDNDNKVSITSNISKLEKIFDRMKNLRKNGLNTASKEMSSGNIIWKICRSEGYIDKIWNLINKNYDKINSINENMTNKEIDVEANKANKHPSDAQKKSGNYKMGHVNVLGFDISIENPKGSYRYWKTDDGKTGKTLIKNHYGYFNRTNGHDGDQVDVFLGSNLGSDKIFIIDQNINGVFDESKVMLGFNNASDAKKAYMSNYDKNWKGFSAITCVDIDNFKKWLYDGRKQQKAFSEYKNIKKID